MADKILTPEEVAKNRRLVAHVRAWMDHRDLKQTELADKMGASEAAVSKWLSGKSTMNAQQFIDMATVLQCTLPQMLGAPIEAVQSAAFGRLAEAAVGLPVDQVEALALLAEGMRRKS